jgi:hypothetical protein
MLTPPRKPPAKSRTRRILRVLCLMAMAPVLALTPLGGQGVPPVVVTVDVRDTSGAPVLNAIVELSDPAGSLLVRRLTDAAGTARLPQPTARNARIDVRRLGFRRETLEWRDGTERLSVRLVPVTTRLARVEVREAPSRCQPGFIPFDADTTLRQVIDAIDVYARQEAALDELFPWIAEWSFAGTDHSGDDRIVATYPRRQYTVDSKRDTLRYARGRMAERRGLTWIKVRFEQVRDLTLPEFLANHCFALAEAPDTALGRPALHLRFRTDKAVRSTDSDGSVYLDPETLAPRKAIFRGANLPSGFSDFEEVVRFCEVTPGVLAPVQRRFWQSYSRPLFVRDVPVEWSRGVRTMLTMRWQSDVPHSVPQPSFASCAIEPAP